MISVFVYSVQSCCPPFLHAAALARSSSAAAPEEKTGFGTIVVGLDITGPLRRFTEKAAKKIRAISAARKPKPWRRRS